MQGMADESRRESGLKMGRRFRSDSVSDPDRALRSGAVRSRTRSACLVLGLLAIAAGCESTAGLGARGTGAKQRADAQPFDSPLAEEVHYRTEYQSQRSKQAMRWLMSHRIQSGMSREEVAHVLGEDGEIEHDDRWIKGNVGVYHVDDVTWCFGPDSEGHSVYLVFRDNRLINFDPKDYTLSQSGSRRRPRTRDQD